MFRAFYQRFFYPLIHALPLLQISKRLPIVQKKIEHRLDALFDHVGDSLHPYKKSWPSFREIPQEGVPREKILQDLREIVGQENQKWQQGHVSGAVYHGGAEHIDFLNQVYALYSQTNPLHTDVWPSLSKFEGEIVSMVAHLLGKSLADQPEEVCGTLTSGGSESIMLAMKTYRDLARHKCGITQPEMIIPSSAHAAFDKAAQYFQIKKISVPVDEDGRANVTKMQKCINKNTIVMVGSAPSFPHGVIDPIEQLATVAHLNGIPFHTDACLGGLLLPWLPLTHTHKVPPFDFRHPGVTSISADTHKFGMSSKGSSVILYRHQYLRHYQYYTSSEWSGGLYCSPTFAGSRPGALIAQCWAALISIGEHGYREMAAKIIATADYIKEEIKNIPQLQIIGDPLFVIAFASRTKHVNIYEVMDFLSRRQWSLNGLHRPSCLHICVTMAHTQEGVAQSFIQDLQEAVQFVQENPGTEKQMAPIYGMAAVMPVQGVVDEVLKRYMDEVYR